MEKKHLDVYSGALFKLSKMKQILDLFINGTPENVVTILIIAACVVAWVIDIVKQRQ